MRILFLSQVFPDDRAPVRGTFNLALCQALSEEHKVRILSPRPWTETLPRRLRGQGPVTAGTLLDHSTLAADYPTYWYLPRIALHRSAHAIQRTVRKPLREMLKIFEPDAVLSYWAHPEGRVALDVARDLNVPSACMVGGSDVLLLPHQNRRRRDEIVRVLQESDAILTVSEGLRHACIELGAAPANVRTIYQGIDHSRFYPRDRVEARRKLRIPQGVTVFVWVGRMVGLKRLDLLVEAVSSLHRGGRRVKLYLLGDGPKRGSVSAYAESLGLGSVVDFVGPVSQDHLPEWYSAADATVLCSDSEGLPNVLRESLACGTPFVATNVGSISEFAPPDCSQLAKPGDVSGLAAGMTTILQPGFRVAAGLYRSRTWSECAHETADLLATLIRNRDIRSDVAAVEPRLDLEALLAQPAPRDPPPAPVVGRPLPEPTAPARSSTAAADDFMSQLNRSLFPGPRSQQEVSR